jgi:hypothetical protein
MSQYLEQPALFDQVIRLGMEERKEPLRVFERFFGDYRLYEWRHHLWTMVEACLTTDCIEFGEGEDRANLLLRYEDLEKLLEAAWLIWQQRMGGAVDLHPERASGEEGQG